MKYTSMYPRFSGSNSSIINEAYSSARSCNLESLFADALSIINCRFKQTPNYIYITKKKQKNKKKMKNLQRSGGADHRRFMIALTTRRSHNDCLMTCKKVTEVALSGPFRIVVNYFYLLGPYLVAYYLFFHFCRV